MTTAAIRIDNGAALVFYTGTTAAPLAAGNVGLPATPGPFTMGNGTLQDIDVDCSGVAFGDFAFASFSGDLQGVVMTANVDEENGFIVIELRNDTGGNVTLNGTFYGFTLKAF